MPIKFLDVVLNEAKKSPMAVQYGALLIYRNKIVSSSHNYYKTHSNSIKLKSLVL